DCTPVSPSAGSFFHADPHLAGSGGSACGGAPAFNQRPAPIRVWVDGHVQDGINYTSSPKCRSNTSNGEYL
ncbi:hypothetical protein, partial [Methylorubrum extorquens]|uniref:hypothetical protein n=1 Tax=Methylorubrum extorquens TaxID=408 RepID=UPI001AED84D6